MRKNYLCLCMKLWRCEMSVDDEFEIEVGINGLKRKDLKGRPYLEKTGIGGNQGNCLYIYVCLVCVDGLMTFEIYLIILHNCG